MKKEIYLQFKSTSRLLGLMLLGLLILNSAITIWAEPVPAFRFVVMGDHRGDNKAVDKVTLANYTDGGITKAALIDLAKAIKDENVAFVLNVGDLVTKYTPALVNINSNALVAAELADWANIWRTYAGEIPLYPVRGNQEVSASIQVWKDFVATLPQLPGLVIQSFEDEQGVSYSFQYLNCLFVGIDQYMPPANNDVHYISPGAIDWISEQLNPRYNKLTSSGHKFVWGHTPAFPIWDFKAKPFAAIKDGLPSPFAQFTFETNGIRFMETREIFWDILGHRKAEYFCGHDHIFARGMAADSKGRLVRQTTIGNGGAPPPILPPLYPPADYIKGPYVEAYTGIAFPTFPAGLAYQLEFPRIATESFPLFEIPPSPPKVTGLPYGYGYVVVEVDGPRVTAVYKAEPAAGAGFTEIDRWVIADGQE